ncbi:TMEM198/TM7SF3 family protein [Intestinimonas butyriciproducens]|uniref:TMEM198/TM7SF3 family protein n=1 Tax=Intestinimonas butyriciproducens TaxID=1297617 RepID=UPI001FAF1777|nr:TMEM198/TM7SF3 family protein [Intestinimonas butyriciproducens]
MELFREIDEASTSIDNAFSVLYAFFVIFGALECFFGYKLFRIMTAIVGFLVGGLIGAMVCAILVGEPAGAFFGFLVFGALGSWLSFKLYKLAIFVLCFLLGGILGLGLGLMSGDMEAAPLLIVFLGILLGVLGVVLTKPVIIISSALGGGISIGASLDAFLGGDGVGVYSTTLENQLFSWFDWVPGEERKDTLYSPENFEEIMAQYTWVTDLFTFHDFDGASFDRGILPEPEVTPDVQRRIALLDILDGQQNLKYAKLIDLNQDGQEDLLTLYSSNLPGETWVRGYRFRAYVWDGQQVQEINLAQTGDAEIDVHLKFWPGPQCALYQKMDGGQIYVCYDGEIAGGWGGTLFVNSLDPADYEFCSYPAMAGSDYSPDQYTEEENMELQEGYARQEEAYNAVMARYQFMEYAHVESPYNLESESAYEEIVSQLKKTVQMVIQQLQNGERSAATENTAPM